jgi:Stage II sporulation protein E (SpoIIE)
VGRHRQSAIARQTALRPPGFIEFSAQIRSGRVILGVSMMRSRSRQDLRPSSPWKTTPRWSIVVFLLAVFFIFASFGFVLDGIDMGRQPALRFVFSVLLIGLFSVAYAVTGITFRQRFWMPFIPLFILENICMALLNGWLPDAPAFTHLDAAQLNHFHNRLAFDGFAMIASVVLGYVGFIVVSISEARRRTRLELDKASLETEMAAAGEIQRFMVPEELPQTPGYAIESIYRPAAQVGGDFFQVIPLGGGQTLVVVGDVSGKGLRAAMIVSMLVGMLHTISRVSQDPAQILAELNSRLFERKREGFVTCVVVRLDPSGRVALANAGHLPPWLNGSEVALAGSLPMSLVASATPEAVTLEMRRGDRLTLLTDGVVEARDAQGELFGFDRTQSLLRQEASSLALAEAAIRHGQDDDLTVISILRTA